MADSNLVVTVANTAPKLRDGVLSPEQVETAKSPGCVAYLHYNGPTDQLSGVSAGMAVLEPGASPHPPHTHPEEEFLIVAEGTGEIECNGKVTEAGPGAIMYVAGNILHGVTNTGKTNMIFYWSKWLAKGAQV